MYWDNILWSTLAVIGSVLVGAMVAFVMYTLLIYAPVSLHGRAECLELGFPDSETTLSLDTYCINIEGAVEGTVMKLED